MTPKKTTQAEATTPKTKKLNPEGMRIIAMQVENIKRVSYARIRPKGNVVEVTGENGSGKSTVLDSIDWALTGLSNVPSQPIRAGQRVGRIQLQIGGSVVKYNIERTFTKVKNGKTPYLSKLFVYTEDKMQAQNPQTLLDTLLGAISFDPLEFTRMKDADQLETLRKLAVFKKDIDQLEAERKAAYDQRRDAGRDLDAVRARLNGMKKPDDTLPQQPIDTAAIEKQLSEAAQHKSAVEAKKSQRSETERQIEASIATAKKLREDASHYLGKAFAEDGIQYEMVPVESSKNNVQADLQKILNAIVVPEPIDTVALTEKLTQAHKTNAAIREAAAYRALEAEFKLAESQYNILDTLVKSKTSEREEAIAQAKMPLPGFSVGDKEVFYNGLPFSQASNAEQIRVSVALGIACNPTLRVMRIKDGSLLDNKSMAILHGMAEDSDTQIWIERVGGDGQVGITMVDGEASGEETEPLPAEQK